MQSSLIGTWLFLCWVYILIGHPNGLLMAICHCYWPTWFGHRVALPCTGGVWLVVRSPLVNISTSIWVCFGDMCIWCFSEVGTLFLVIPCLSVWCVTVSWVVHYWWCQWDSNACRWCSELGFPGIYKYFNNVEFFGKSFALRLLCAHFILIVCAWSTVLLIQKPLHAINF